MNPSCSALVSGLNRSSVCLVCLTFASSCSLSLSRRFSRLSPPLSVLPRRARERITGTLAPEPVRILSFSLVR